MRRRGGAIIFIHAEAPAALEGHGIAGTMAHIALEDARAQRLAVLPRPFVASYIWRHPEYANLVPPGDPARLLAHEST